MEAGRQGGREAGRGKNLVFRAAGRVSIQEALQLRALRVGGQSEPATTEIRQEGVEEMAFVGAQAFGLLRFSVLLDLLVDIRPASGTGLESGELSAGLLRRGTDLRVRGAVLQELALAEQWIGFVVRSQLQWPHDLGVSQGLRGVCNRVKSGLRVLQDLLSIGFNLLDGGVPLEGWQIHSLLPSSHKLIDQECCSSPTSFSQSCWIT